LTPAYNAAAFLPALLASIAAIPASIDYEWVLVDDGSTDATGELFRVAADSRASQNWRLVSQANAGVATARNRALSEATGMYVWFVDADDLVVADAVIALCRVARDRPDLVVFQALRFADGLADAPVFQHAKSTREVTGEQWVADLLRTKEWKHFLWQYWYRRQMLVDAKLQFQAGIVHEDIAIVTEAALRAERVRYSPEAAYRYRVNPGSLTSNRDERRLRARVESYFVVVEQLRDINRRFALQRETLGLLRGEIIGQALQVFELAKQMTSAEAREQVKRECEKRRFAQGLFQDVTNFKRLRQALTILLKQAGYWPIGRERVGAS
jgi:heptose III glucuronosyltransferase